MFSLLLGSARAVGSVSRECGDGGTREREQRERDNAGEGVEVVLDHWAMGAVPTLLSHSVGSTRGKQGSQVHPLRPRFARGTVGFGFGRG